MTVIKYLQLPFRVDVDSLQQEVDAIAQLHWQLHYQYRHYQGKWSAIPLRSVEGNASDIFVAPNANVTYKNTHFLEQSTYLQEVLAHFKCPLLAVRLLKLDAGAIIKEHRDADLSFENGEIRVHIPIRTHELVAFYLDKEQMQIKEGECWYMNFNLPHSIHNKSNIDRIHLVIDGLVNEWVNDIFDQPGLLRKKTEPPGHDTSTQLRIIEQLRQMNSETGNRLADEMEAGLA